MAKKKPETTDKKSETTVKKTDTSKKPVATIEQKSQSTDTSTGSKQGKKTKSRKNAGGMLTAPLRAIGRYFKGSWFELRQVRWPTRRATWGLTFAVLIFTAFFVAIIMGLDYVFQQVFERIIL